MDFSWLKRVQETAKEVGKGVGGFIKDNQDVIVDAIKVTGGAIIAYYTIKGLFYSKKLDEVKKSYESSLDEKYRKQAKEIFTEVLNILKDQTLTKAEHDELQSILNQHSAWVYA